MLRWLLLAACSISATADPSETCARVARAHLPQGPLIIKPQPNEVVIASSDDLLDEQSYVNANVSYNLRVVTLQLDYSSPLQGHITSEEHASCLRLLVVVGRARLTH
jgi:hypothetical protein